MYKELNTLGVRDVNYFSLVRKVDDKEVYTCPAYVEKDCPNIFDFDKIRKMLGYYFERVNSGIQQQLESPRLTEEQKKELKLLDKVDYKVKYMKLMPLGYAEHVYWTKEAKEFFN